MLYLLLVFLLQSVHHLKVLVLKLAFNQLSPGSLRDLHCRRSPLWKGQGNHC